MKFLYYSAENFTTEFMIYILSKKIYSSHHPWISWTWKTCCCWKFTNSYRYSDPIHTVRRSVIFPMAVCCILQKVICVHNKPTGPGPAICMILEWSQSNHNIDLFLESPWENQGKEWESGQEDEQSIPSQETDSSSWIKLCRKWREESPQRRWAKPYLAFNYM